ncbi:MBL fold metallo-hydrolase [Paenibacillus nasutitermitis]|uniref:Metallo-beta-lactamase domain-containing protein n=1 Tax=Paenibacillus nasutitermitis TaxID=1652958 RepID=A0A917E2J2_9BACL|nr:MBL fold metallo-hydrolase [Paenibacillus nasutitermitis]GGD93550.1 hypothetical protein GCM10010911_60260 [Paenibacillus nasutitermitis]
MTSLLHELQDTAVAPGSIAVWSLGQAGYACKLPSGQVVLIDPYITDYSARRLGHEFKRLMPSVITPEELDRLPIAAYLLTHHHEDHLDADCVTAMKSRDFPFYGPPETIRMLKELGVEEGRCHSLKAGCSHELEEMTISAVFADHGELAPDAVGIIVRAEGKAIYHMGDTCLREDCFRESVKDMQVDLLLVPINGKYGNMNEAEAAQAASLINPAIAAPCHFWMLPGNSGGDPLVFVNNVKSMAPLTIPFLFRQGELLIV